MGISGTLTGVAVSLMLGVAGCATCPVAPEAAQQSISLEAPAACPTTGDSDLLECSWIASTDHKGSEPTGVEGQDVVRRLPPVNPDLLATDPATEPRQESLADRSDRQRYLRPLLRDVGRDYRNFYSGENLGFVAIGIGLASIAANTTVDGTVYDEFHENVTSNGARDILHGPKIFGEGEIFIPAFAATAVVGSWVRDAPLGHGMNEWGNRSFRTALVGAPPMLAVQWLTGGSRPGERNDASHWDPFRDDNGASGHAFMGAIPFLSAAHMTDSPFWKTAFYAGSTLPGLSRINDYQHYPSQVVLGWWMAYLSAAAVEKTEGRPSNLTVYPTPGHDGLGFTAQYRR